MKELRPAVFILSILHYSYSNLYEEDYREKRQAKTVGKICEHRTDCGRGAYCAGNKLCACLSTFINIDEYCWPKVNPGESGCTKNKQCEATWPGSYCSQGQCRCANNQPGFQTKDGKICLNYGHCPFGGEEAKFRTSDEVMECRNGIDEICPRGYDCICNTPGCDSQQPGSTFCCPSRALTCIMDMDPGRSPSSGGGTTERYYFNSVTGECEPFAYGGSKGNANNFETKHHCESYCKQTCSRGQPQYDDAVYPSVRKSVLFCGMDSEKCAQSHKCTSIGTNDICCPKPVVCAAGEPLKDATGQHNLACSNTNPCPATHECTNNICCPKKQTICKLPQAIGSCGNYAEKWWFNAETGDCIQFTYSGCQGNANNFESFKECAKFCRDATVQPQCIQGTPLRDSYGNFIICDGDAGYIQKCPAKHYCYYDGKTYGCCPTQSYTCSLGPNPGTKCGPTVLRWYFDSSKRACVTFDYYGCDGNSNNFAMQQDCKDYCRVDSCPDGGDPWKNGNGANKQCQGSSGCPTTHYCTPVSKRTRRGPTVFNYCCPRKEYVCSRHMDVGVRCSSTTLTRYWFNSMSKTCEKFDYNGCDGNNNNFPSKKACENYCMSSACEPGAIVLQDADSGQLATCTLGTTNSGGCPSGFRCEKSELLNQPVCCGGKKEFKDLCPAASRAFMDAQSLQPMQCAPNVDASCPGGYYCWYSYNPEEELSGYYCCRLTKSSQLSHKEPEDPDDGVCPPKLYPVHTAQMAYKKCSPTAPPTDMTSGCGPAVSCQWSEKIKFYVCCARVKGHKPPEISPTTPEPSVCPPMPPNMEPLFEQTGYRTCSPQSLSEKQGGCPIGSYCLYTEVLRKYICCQQHTKSQALVQLPMFLQPPVRPSPAQQPKHGNLALDQVPPISPLNIGSSVQPQTQWSQRIPGVSVLQPVFTKQLAKSKLPTKLLSFANRPQLSPPYVKLHHAAEVQTSRSASMNLKSPECSEAPGFLPIKQPLGKFKYCSPMKQNSCNQFENPNVTMARCMYSIVQSKYLCCQSVLPFH